MAGKANYLVRAKNGAVFVTSTLAEAKKVEASGAAPAKRRRNPAKRGSAKRRNPSAAEHLKLGFESLSAAEKALKSYAAAGLNDHARQKIALHAMRSADLAYREFTHAGGSRAGYAAQIDAAHDALEEAQALLSHHLKHNPAKRRRNPSAAEHLQRGAKRYGIAVKLRGKDLDAATRLAFSAESDLEDGGDHSGSEDAHALGLSLLRARRNPAKCNPAGYYTVVIPPTRYDQPDTEWHANRTVTRGAFSSKAKATAWAKEHLRGYPYSIKKIDLSRNPSAARVYSELEYIPSRDGDYILSVEYLSGDLGRVVARSLRTAHAKAAALTRQGATVQISKQIGSGADSYSVPVR